jgi:uncharacterized membrane protein YbhN (UPF0104 family)
VQQVGTAAFLHGIRSVTAGSMVAAAALAVVSTASSAYRWSLVGRGLGVEVRLGRGMAAYYRSQFLNTVLPGGVLGDVHRAVGHGREVDDLGRCVRAVAWERSAGQAVQLMITLLVLVALPAPSGLVLGLLIVVVLVLLGVAVVLTRPSRLGTSRWSRICRAIGGDLRQGLLAPGIWPGVAVSSLIVVACHTATFVLAARTAGVTAGTAQLLPLVLLVMLAMAVPTNVGGWGPREGAAAWLFAAAGLGAAQGVAAAAAYGVLALVATLPGGVVLVFAWLRRPPVPREGVDAIPVVRPPVSPGVWTTAGLD